MQINSVLHYMWCYPAPGIVLKKRSQILFLYSLSFDV